MSQNAFSMGGKCGLVRRGRRNSSARQAFSTNVSSILDSQEFVLFFKDEPNPFNINKDDDESDIESQNQQRAGSQSRSEEETAEVQKAMFKLDNRVSKAQRHDQNFQKSPLHQISSQRKGKNNIPLTTKATSNPIYPVVRAMRPVNHIFDSCKE